MEGEEVKLVHDDHDRSFGRTVSGRGWWFEHAEKRRHRCRVRSLHARISVWLRETKAREAHPVAFVFGVAGALELPTDRPESLSVRCVDEAVESHGHERVWSADLLQQREALLHELQYTQGQPESTTEQKWGRTMVLPTPLGPRTMRQLPVPSLTTLSIAYRIGRSHSSRPSRYG